MRYFFTCLLLFLVFSREDVLGCGVSRCHRPRARIWREWNIKGKQGSIVIHKFLSKKLVRLCVCTLNNIKQDLTVILVHFPFIIVQIMSSKRCLLKQDNEVSFQNTVIDSCHLLYYCQILRSKFLVGVGRHLFVSPRNRFKYIYISKPFQEPFHERDENILVFLGKDVKITFIPTTGKHFQLPQVEEYSRFCS